MLSKTTLKKHLQHHFHMVTNYKLTFLEEAKLEAYQADIGFGVDASQNQKELRMMREASKLSNKPHEIAQLFSGSHPSQGDLLEMIDTSANSKIKFC